MAANHSLIATLYAQKDEINAALEQYRTAIAIQQRLIARDPANAIWQFFLASLYAGMGDILKKQDKLPDALERYKMAYELRQALALKDPSNPGQQNSLALTAISVADVLEAQKQNLDEAVRFCREAIMTLDEARPRYDRDVFHC